MNNEAEIAVAIYFLVATLVVISGVSFLIYIWLRGIIKETRNFVQLMLTLYEQEKERQEKQDSGGTGDY